MAITTLSVMFLAAVTLSLAAAQAINDTAILQLSLNFECGQAEYFSWAVFGHGLNNTLLGRARTSADIGGQKAKLSDAVQDYFTEVANDDINHVAFLRAVLGPQAVPCPTLNVGTSFPTVINAALGNAATSYVFSPYTDDISFELGAFIFKDVSVTGYTGGIPLLTNPTNIGYLAEILAVEAAHASLIRILLFQSGALPVAPYTIQTIDLAQDISNLRAAIGGGNDAGITNPPANGQLYVPYITEPKYNSVIIPTNNFSLAYARTFTEVLAIAYGGNPAVPGVFFPDSVNVLA